MAPNPEIDVQNLDRAIKTDLRNGLPTLVLVMAALFAFYSVWYGLEWPDPVAKVMLPTTLISGSVMGGLYFVLRRWEIPLRYEYPLLAIISVLLAGATSQHVLLTQDPTITSNIALLIVGLGFYVLAPWWWGALVGAATLNWVLLAQHFGFPPVWQHYAYSIVAAIALSLAVFLTRRQTYRRLEYLRRLEQQQHRNMEAALRTNERIRRSLEATIGVGQHISSMLELDSLLQHVADLLRMRYGYEYVGIYVLDETRQTLQLQAATGSAGRKLLQRGHQVPVDGSGILSWAAQHRRVVGVNDVQKDARYEPLEELPRTRSELVLPLLVNNALLGLLDIQSTVTAGFNEEDVRVLRSLAGQLAIAMQNAERYQVERRRRHLTEKLYHVGKALSSTLDRSEVLNLILKLLADLVPYDRGAVMLRNEVPDHEELIFAAVYGFPEDSNPLDLRIPIKEHDVFLEMCETQRPLVVQDVQQRGDWEYVENLPPARCWVGIPLHHGGNAIGMLSLTREKPIPYTEEEVNLAAAFAGHASAALANAILYENLTKLNEELEQTVNQLQERTEDLQLAYAQLERLDRTKSDFIGVASHELRTPLTVISGSVQILLSDPAIQANSFHQQILEGVKTGAERLGAVVESMVDMAKIDGRVLKLHPERLNLALLVASVHRSLKDAFSQRRLTYVSKGLEELPKIEADPESLRKVFHHLLVNAIKYTPNGGTITVAGEVVPAGSPHLPEGGIQITVQDTGIGIDPSVHELIFAKFYQTGELALHSTSSTKFKGGGPGLGLAIARGIIEAHGGKIWVESPGHDEETCPGSTFYIQLPYSSRTLLNETANAPAA